MSLPSAAVSIRNNVSLRSNFTMQTKLKNSPPVLSRRTRKTKFCAGSVENLSSPDKMSGKFCLKISSLKWKMWQFELKLVSLPPIFSKHSYMVYSEIQETIWSMSTQATYLHNSSNDSRCQQMFHERMYMHTQHKCKQKNSKDMQITDISFLGEVKIQLLHKDMYIYNIAVLIFELS